MSPRAFITAVAVGLAFLGLAIVASGASGRPIRRARIWRGLLLMAAAGLGWWSATGGDWPVPRVYVVAMGDDLGNSERAEILKALDPGAPVVLLRLKAAEKVPAGDSAPAGPTWVSAAAVGDGTPEASIRCNPVDWPKQLVDSAQRMLADRPTSLRPWQLLARPTILVIPGRDKVWRTLRATRFNPSTLARALADEPRCDLFVIDPPSLSSPGRLEIVLASPAVPAAILNMIGEAVNLHLVDVPRSDPSRPTTVHAFLDGPMPGDEADALAGSTRYEGTFQEPLKDAPDGATRVLSFQLGNLKPTYRPRAGAGTGNADVLRAGWHRLTVQVTLPTLVSGRRGQEVYEATHYVLAESREVVVLRPKGSLGALADPSWAGLDRPRDASVLLGQYLNLAPDRSQRTRVANIANHLEFELPVDRYVGGPIDPIRAGTQGRDDWASAGALGLAAGRAKLLVLVEPTYTQLTYLDGLLDLPSRIKDGLNVLVVVPPTAGTSKQPVAGLPSWLPAYARPADPASEKEPLQVRRDPRLYLLPDNSRLLQFPAGNADYSPLDAQRDAIRRLYGALDARDGSGVPVANQARVVDGRVFGPSAIAVGRIGSGATERTLTIFPPISHFVSNLEANIEAFYQKDIGGVRGGLGRLMDVAPSSLPRRLRATMERQPGETLIEGFQPLEPPHFHPESVVVAFVADLPQLDGPRVAVAIKDDMIRAATTPGALAASAAPGPADVVTRLARQGVRVVIVKVAVSDALKKSYRDALKSLQQPLGARLVEPVDAVRLDPAVPSIHAELIANAPPPVVLPDVLLCSPESAARVGESLATLIRELPAGTLRRDRGGRAIDERAEDGRPAPRLHAVLIAMPPESPLLDPPHAWIVDGDKVRPFLKPLGMVRSRVAREGQVVALGYSPFALDTWQRDAGEAGWPKGPVTPKKTDGWGVQRLIDGAGLGAVGRVLPRHPVVRAIRPLDDGASVLIDCWADPRESLSPRMPTIHAAPSDLAGTPLRLVAVDRPGRRITFQIQADDAHPRYEGSYRISLADNAVPGVVDSSFEVYLSLRSSLGAGRDVREALTTLAWMAGGARVAAGAAEKALAYRVSAAWFATLALVGVLTALFLPPARPWTALGLALRSRRQAREFGETESPAAAFDTDTLLNEWGLNPGLPRSSRRAGLPAGVKEFGSGDTLSSARPGTLLGLTSVGRSLGLPPRRPVVRLRHVGQSMEAAVLVDASPGLLEPRFSDFVPKAAFLEHLAAVIASAVWKQAGTAVILSTADFESSWGPSGAADALDDLRLYIRGKLAPANRALADRNRLVVPEAFRTNRVLFLLTDLSGSADADFETLAEDCAREGVALRVAHVHDPTAERLVGLVRDAVSGRLIDRTEVDPPDLARAFEAQADRVRSLVERHGAHFVTFGTDLTPAELGDLLRESEFLS